jgi:hypothetical protein
MTKPSTGTARKLPAWGHVPHRGAVRRRPHARFPEAWHPLGEGVRRCGLSRFPYGLIYTIDEGDILVLAVAHLHRRQDYWRDRLQR